MEKTIDIVEGALSVGSVGSTAQSEKEKVDHTKIWREIYRDVRRQWAEAEQGSMRQSGYAK